MSTGADQAAGTLSGHLTVRPSDRIIAGGERIQTRILIVEDDPIDRDILLRKLARSRFMEAECVCADTLDDATAKLRAGAFDFVILDFWVKGTSTLPLLDLISREYTAVVPISVTSIDFTDVQGLGLSYGALGYLHKSDLTVSALDAVLRTGMSQRDRRAVA
jgi:DNA-binding NtrC family response regulator